MMSGALLCWKIRQPARRRSSQSHGTTSARYDVKSPSAGPCEKRETMPLKVALVAVGELQLHGERLADQRGEVDVVLLRQELQVEEERLRDRLLCVELGEQQARRRRAASVTWHMRSSCVYAIACLQPTTTVKRKSPVRLEADLDLRERLARGHAREHLARDLRQQRVRQDVVDGARAALDLGAAREHRVDERVAVDELGRVVLADALLRSGRAAAG